MADRQVPAAALLLAALGLWQGVASLPGVDDLTLASQVETARALAELRGMSAEEFGHVTSMNFKRVFKLDQGEEESEQ